MKSLAVKYRPRTYEEVVGQDNIMKVLQNQSSTGGAKQGYLFTGGAGTGKTSVARIHANALNAEVVEIDAASNTGIDRIREIREQVNYKPLNHEIRVYIIDETHMLSTGAFNALLKTLEEPPPHVVFILATTDPQKIPATILSRIQRFDFKRLPLEEVKKRLMYIIEQENEEREEEEKYIVADDAMEYIAKLTDGGMRDAISLLDTLISYKNKIEIDDVFDVLGTPEIESFIKLITEIYNKDQKEVIQIIEDIYADGKDLKLFIREMTAFIVELKKLLLFKGMQYVKMPELYEGQMKELVNHINRNSDIGVNKELDKLFESINELNNKIKYETQVKVTVEGELMCLC